MTDDRHPESPEGPVLVGAADGYDDDGYDDYDDEYDDDGYDDYVALPRQTSTARKVVMVLLALLLIVAGLAGVGAWWVLGQIDPSGPPGEELVFTIEQGATTSDVATELEAQGIITNATIFRWYLKTKDTDSFQAGDYDDIHLNSAMGDVIDRLAEGPLPPAFLQITIPEGLRVTEAVPTIIEQMPGFNPDEFNAALAALDSEFKPADVTSLEGFLFPNTYRIEEGDEIEEKKLLDQMVGELDETLTELGYDEANSVGLSPYELIIVASLIEEEAKIPEDQAKISRVIHNRLDQGMTLGIDATILYEIGHKEELLQSDLETDSPYNSRLYKGLPPTPITNPGRGALDAAIHPADGPWLYYVLADTNGGHFFTDDYDEFLNQKRISQEQGIF